MTYIKRRAQLPVYSNDLKCLRDGTPLLPLFMQDPVPLQSRAKWQLFFQFLWCQLFPKEGSLAPLLHGGMERGSEKAESARSAV